MNNKAKQLADLYNELAEKETGFLYCGLPSEQCPDLKSDLSKWQVIDSVKIIDKNMIKESGIDCQFAIDHSDWYVWSSPLTENTMNYDYYRIRQDHWFYNIWDECPLPEGLLIDFRVHIGSNCIHYNYTGCGFDWSNVIAFKVNGILEGYSYD